MAETMSLPKVDTTPPPPEQAPVAAESSLGIAHEQYDESAMDVAEDAYEVSSRPDSIYCGGKMTAIKKEDGQPLMKKDIQFEFLRAVFLDETRAFTSSYDPTKEPMTFAELYIEAMAKSERTSNVLREKLYNEKESALSMAMICLLVNLGRMNTTLNFFPEMRAQLRTYHAIPSLQAKNDPNAYKALQDAPRLKSILKGSCTTSEGLPAQPATLESFDTMPRPRCNPIALLFSFAQYASIITIRHFKMGSDFLDLLLRRTVSSKSRAKVFLWLVWWYLESDFSAADSIANPFGAAEPKSEWDHEPGPFVPAFHYLTEAQAGLENVDTEEEIEYGEKKRLERLNFSEQDAMHHYQITKRGPKKIGNPIHGMESGMHVIAGAGGKTTTSGKRKFSSIDEGTESPVNGSRAAESNVKRVSSTARSKRDSSLPNLPSTAHSPADKPGTQSRFRLSKGRRRSHTSKPRARSPNPIGSFLTARALLSRPIEPSPLPSPTPIHLDDDLLAYSGNAHNNRKRQPNSHQRAVQANRDQQVEYIIVRKLRESHRQWRATTRRVQPDIVVRSLARLAAQTDWWADSEDDDVGGSEGVPADEGGPRYWELSRDERAEVSVTGRLWANGGREPGWSGVVRSKWEEEDWGAEAAELEQGGRRLWRRLRRWMGDADDELGREIREDRRIDEEEQERREVEEAAAAAAKAAAKAKRASARRGAVGGGDGVDEGGEETDGSGSHA